MNNFVVLDTYELDKISAGADMFYDLGYAVGKGIKTYEVIVQIVHLLGGHNSAAGNYYRGGGGRH